MKRFILVLVAAISLCGISVLSQGVPHVISYQGVLTNAAGVPLEGIQNVTFSIFDQETGGAMLWSEASQVTCTHGAFDVLLGNNVPLNIEFTAPIWLEISIGSTALTPRIHMASVPFAYTAQTVANGSITRQKMAPLSATGNATLVWNGSEWVEQPFVVAPSLQSSYNSGRTVNETNGPISLVSNAGNATSALDVLFGVTETGSGKSAIHAQISSPSLPQNSQVSGGVGSYATADGKHFFSGVSGSATKADSTANGFVGTMVDGSPYAGYFNGKVLINGWLGINTTSEPLYALDVNGDISAFNVHTSLIDVENGSIFSRDVIATGNIVTSAGKMAIGKEEPVAELDVVGSVAVTGQISSATFSTGQMSAANLLVDNSFSSMNFLGVRTIDASSSLNVQGSMALKTTTVTDNATLTIDDNVVIANSANNLAITLPSAASCAGRIYTIKNVNSNGIATVTAAGGETIDYNGTTRQLQYASATMPNCISIISDGTAWVVISKF